jgi:tRNA(His) guanylyltransferase
MADVMSIGDRMKTNYENRTRYYLPRRTYTVIRIDGKAFHTFTKGFQLPYDLDFMDMMNLTALKLVSSIQGCKLAYVQSDEINLVLTDFDNIGTDAWFDGNVQKMASVSASIATAEFNRRYLMYKCKYWQSLRIPAISPEEIQAMPLAEFDSRVFTVPELEEVVNLLIWRQQDATRNSIQLAGQNYFSHKKLQNLNCNQIQEMLFAEAGVNWNDYPESFKRGRVAHRCHIEIPEKSKHGGVINMIVNENIPVFTADRDYLKNLINVSATQSDCKREESE